MKPLHLIVHHTGGSDANPLQDSSNYTVAQCNQDHKVRFNFKSKLGWYVGYQYFIDKFGTVTQCRLDDEEGAHTIGQNTSSIGICLAGNFDATLPTESQKTALKTLLEKKMAEYSIPVANIVPHRKFATKTCYGNKLVDDWAQKLVKQATDTLTPLVTLFNQQIASKDYKKARDTSSLLFTELGKL